MKSSFALFTTLLLAPLAALHGAETPAKKPGHRKGHLWQARRVAGLLRCDQRQACGRDDHSRSRQSTTKQVAQPRNRDYGLFVSNSISRGREEGV